MCIQNSSFVALPVPGIIGGTQKISAVPGYASAPFSLVSSYRPSNPCRLFLYQHSFAQNFTLGGVKTPNLGDEEAVEGRDGTD